MRNVTTRHLAGMQAYCRSCHKHVVATQSEGGVAGGVVIDTPGDIDFIVPVRQRTRYFCPHCGSEVETGIQKDIKANNVSQAIVFLPVIIVMVLMFLSLGLDISDKENRAAFLFFLFVVGGGSIAYFVNIIRGSD